MDHVEHLAAYRAVLQAKGLSRATQDHYCSNVERFLNWLDGRRADVRLVTEADAREFLFYLANTLDGALDGRRGCRLTAEG